MKQNLESQDSYTEWKKLELCCYCIHREFEVMYSQRKSISTDLWMAVAREINNKWRCFPEYGDGGGNMYQSDQNIHLTVLLNNITQ